MLRSTGPAPTVPGVRRQQAKRISRDWLATVGPASASQRQPVISVSLSFHLIGLPHFLSLITLSLAGPDTPKLGTDHEHNGDEQGGGGRFLLVMAVRAIDLDLYRVSCILDLDEGAVLGVLRFRLLKDSWLLWLATGHEDALWPPPLAAREVLLLKPSEQTCYLNLYGQFESTQQRTQACPPSQTSACMRPSGPRQSAYMSSRDIRAEARNDWGGGAWGPGTKRNEPQCPRIAP